MNPLIEALRKQSENGLIAAVKVAVTMNNYGVYVESKKPLRFEGLEVPRVEGRFVSIDQVIETYKQSEHYRNWKALNTEK